LSLRRQAARIRRTVFEACGSRRYSRPGQYDLDRKLAKYLDFKGGFFVEAGANDGFSQSNTYVLERFSGWSGILIEGIPELAEHCRRLRRRSRVYNCALVAPDFGAADVRMHYANLMSVVDESLETQAAQDRHLQQGRALQGLRYTYDVMVPARTLTSILDAAGAPSNIDFLSLDVEGYEPQVLRGLDRARYRPRYILVEVRFSADVGECLKPEYELLEAITPDDHLYALRE